jgi:PTS system cellobiose-specific IIA component
MGDESVVSAFKIIASVGSARGSYIEAVRKAKLGNFSAAEEAMLAGNRFFGEGHAAHSALIQAEAGGKSVDLNLLLVHAEGQLMSAEAFKILAAELIDVHKKFKALEESKG